MHDMHDDGLGAIRGCFYALKIYVIAIGIGTIIYWIF
jgi:hypothetical protein